MFNNFYNILINTKLRSINLFNYLSVAEKYDKIHTDPFQVFDGNGDLINKEMVESEPAFISVKDDDGNKSCVVFYGNLFILFSVNDELNDRIVQIYIKRPEDEWKVQTKENGKELDLFNPSNVKIEVYVNYDVSVCKLNRRLSRCGGEEYRSGKWNGKFYKALNSFIDKVEGYTEINQIKQAYEK